jgi:cell division protein FtsI/penicillin-binding protein 2
MNFKIKNLKRLTVITCTIVLFISQMLLVGCSKAAKPSETFDSYKNYWENQDFKNMYGLLSTKMKEEITEDAFVTRYQNIYKGIEADNVKLKYGDVESLKQDENKNIIVPFSVVMDTLAGNVEIPGYNMTLSEEKINDKNKWTVNWDVKLIFPNLGVEDEVRATTIYPKRGEINDKNGKALAINGDVNIIGIVPNEFNAAKDKSIPQMAEILDISQEKIANLLERSTNPEWFVPIVNLSLNDKEKAIELTSIDGVKYQASKGRVYPGSEAFGNLIGYIGPITAEEKVAHKDEGYTDYDKIGKMGLEKIYEKRLRGEKGGKIYIDIEGKGVSEKGIVSKEAKDGEIIKLSIDFDLQKKIYDEMKGDAGASTAINPKTGEILALVSSPSFDSNLFSTYVPDSIRSGWKTAEKDPFVNRFASVYAPGSVFKLVTGAIGLKTGLIKPNETLDITGTGWQPSKAWGANKVTRVTDIGRPVNLLDAYIYSDNIYFARQALKIGKDKLTSGAKSFGIGETLPIDFPISKSQLSNSGLNSEQLIAATGFGQGEVQLSILDVALFYSSLANNGDIMTPVLELKGNLTPKVWKEKAVAKDNVKTITDDLVQVVENPSGTANTNPPSNVRLLGKTGTAELKKNQEDKGAEENGWFVAMDVENPRLVVAMMIEDVKDRKASHYVVPTVKKIFDDMLK